MTDKRSFLLAVCAAVVSCSGWFLAARMVRSRAEGWAAAETAVLVAGIVVAVPVLMVLVSAVMSVAGGWTARARRLASAHDWQILVAVHRTGRLADELRRTVHPPVRHDLPWALTLAADDRHLVFFSGRAEPVAQLVFPWSDVVDVRTVTTWNGALRTHSLRFVVRWGATTMQVESAVLGGWPLSVWPLGAERVEVLRGEIVALRSNHVRV
ncbi:hypothetical protein N1031_13500 [Herbiconiux moechotypicola]|uniref:Uncharacterized protein n=1 Tax=Herbiconiux moechotypicola TaxID=637393 RepID=A0ABP5QSJ3_9MICO|nr:hypothetical protein [Herbiconiux moechotypicola]MCS5730777.1 hypothetical protein [Herbiconiux moechotypicola]